MFNSFGSVFMNSSSESDTDWASLSPYSIRGSTRSSDRNSSSCSGSYTSAKSLQKNCVAFKPGEDAILLRPQIPAQSLALDVEFPTGCRFMDFSNCSTDSNLSSVEDSEWEESDTSAIFQRYLYSHRHLDFPKYIPVKDNATTLYVPKCSFHKVYQQEWKDAQHAYELQHAQENLPKARGSKSDNSEGLDKRRTKQNSRRNNKMAKLVSKIFRYKSRIRRDVHDLGFIHLPRQNNQRFSDAANQQFIDVNLKQNPDFVAILHVQSPRNPNGDLCHIKTELVVAAMLNFLYPYINVQCLWIRNLQEKILKMTVGQIIKSKFNKTIHLRQYEAALVLSKEASALLRHRDTLFIQSLALALDIDSMDLIILVDEFKTVIE